MSSRSTLLPRLCVTALGAGYCPVAPGTAGSLLAVGLYALGMGHWPLWLFALTLAATFCLGFFCIRRYERESGTHDEAKIVIDEVVGQWLALIALPPGWLWLLLAFAAFRLCDIAKPFPANRVDRRPGALAVILDDVVAGAYAWLAVQGLGWLLR